MRRELCGRGGEGQVCRRERGEGGNAYLRKVLPAPAGGRRVQYIYIYCRYM